MSSLSHDDPLAPTTSTPLLRRSGSLRAGQYKSVNLVQTRFETSRLQDAWWGAFFGVHLIAFASFVVFRVRKVYKEELVDVETGYFPALAFSIGLSTCIALLWMILLRNFPVKIVYASAIVAPFLGAYLVVYSLYRHDWDVAIVIALFFSFFTFFLWVVRHKFAFTAVLLELVCQITQDYFGTVILSLSSLVVGIIVEVLYLIAIGLVKHDFKDGDGFRPEGWALFFTILFSLYWTWGVVANVVHVTICGVVGRWYFTDGRDSATKPALRQATTKSFGSICIGAFLLALARTVRVMGDFAHSAAKNSNKNAVVRLVACIIVFLLMQIEVWLDFLCTYAFAYVALYGISFLEASKEVTKLFKATAMDMVVTWDMSHLVTLLGGLIGGCVSSFATWMLMLCHGEWFVRGKDVDDMSFMTDYLAFAFFVGFATVAVVCSVIESGCCSLLVCFAEHPSILEERKPEVFRTIAKVSGSSYNEHYRASLESASTGLPVFSSSSSEDEA